MKKLLVSATLVALFATPLLAAAPPTVAVTQQAASVSAVERMKAMKSSDILRMKVQDPADFAATGIKKQQDGSFMVRHMASDKSGKMKELPK